MRTYTIDEVEEMIMTAEVRIPIEKFFNSKGEHITKKKYGIILLKTLCKELREKYR